MTGSVEIEADEFVITITDVGIEEGKQLTRFLKNPFARRRGRRDHGGAMGAMMDVKAGDPLELGPYTAAEARRISGMLDLIEAGYETKRI